jgi:hypothetical protein
MPRALAEVSWPARNRHADLIQQFLAAEAAAVLGVAGLHQGLQQIPGRGLVGGRPGPGRQALLDHRPDPAADRPGTAGQ